MERVTMRRAEGILWDWFSEHAWHETDENPTRGKVELWCEDCREIRTFGVARLHEAAGQILREEGGVTF